MSDNAWILVTDRETSPEIEQIGSHGIKRAPGRLGKTFPKLKLWYVDPKEDTVEEYSWSNLHD